MAPTQTKDVATGTEELPYEAAKVAYPDMDGAEELGENILYQISGNMLTLQIDLSQRWGPAASGKSILIANTRGIKRLSGTDREDAGGPVSIGVNVFTPLPPKARKPATKR